MSPKRSSSTTIERLDHATLAQISAQQAGLSLVDQIFHAVQKQISGLYRAAGSRMPSVRQLANDCAVSRDTVCRAYNKLVAHGHLESRPGSGYYVRARVEPAPVLAPPRNGPPPAWRHRLVQSFQPYATHTGSGLLPEQWLDQPVVRSALRTVSRASRRSLFGYGDHLGYLPLRQQLQLKLRELGIAAAPEQIMTTLGATDALHLFVMSYLRTPYEVVMVEDPGPFLLLERLSASGIDCIRIARGADGPDIAAMRAACLQYKPKAFFCSPVLHSPTSTNLSAHKAFQILKLAEEFDFPIVEDDTYGDLMPQTSSVPVARLAPLDQLQRVIHIGSFSKTLGAGLRVGYMAASPERVEWMMKFKFASSIALPNLAERAVYQLLSEGGYRQHCMQLRGRLDEQRQPLATQLRAIGLRIDHLPEAGMYLWAALPPGFKSLQVADQMLAMGHLTAPGELFSESMAPPHLRFNVGTSLDSPALAALGALLKERGT